MSEPWDGLKEKARAVATNAYAPYSVYHVGAALLANDGQIYAGCNVENISYGLTICAERSALAAMVAGGGVSWSALVIATEDGGAPCGMCLQSLQEFCEDPETCRILCVGSGVERSYTLAELLPHGFSSEKVKREL